MGSTKGHTKEFEEVSFGVRANTDDVLKVSSNTGLLGSFFYSNDNSNDGGGLNGLLDIIGTIVRGCGQQHCK